MASAHNICDHCARGFTTYSGLRLHVRRAHPVQFNASVGVQRDRRRWTEEEVFILAGLERDLLASQLRVPLQRALAERFPSRTVDAIKGIRRTPAYQRVLAEISVLAMRAVPLDTHREDVRGLILDQLEGEREELRVLGGAMRADQLLTVINGLCDGGDYGEALERWGAEAFPAVTFLRSTPSSERGSPVIGARQRRRHDYARCQRLWAVDKRALAREVLDGRGPLAAIHALGDLELYRRALFEAPSAPWDEVPCVDRAVHGVEALWRPCIDAEIRASFPRRSAAPGPDGISPAWWRHTPLVIIRTVFNLILYRGSMPEWFLRARTVLVPKINEPVTSADYRPITVASVIVRHFHKILAARLNGLALHAPEQRGFVAGVDGMATNIVKVNSLIKAAWSRRRSLYMLKLDVRKAFDSVSHYAILGLLADRGFPQPFIDYVAAAFRDSSMRLVVGGRESAPIVPRRGVRQGDPLSSFLFNLAMDVVLLALPSRVGFWTGSPATRVRAVAYADDLLLFAGSMEGITCLARVAEAELGRCGLAINADKSELLALAHSGRQKLIKVDTQVSLVLEVGPVRVLSIIDQWEYVGVYFDSKGVVARLPALSQQMGRLDRAPLKPQQKLGILRDFLLPSLLHQLVFGFPGRGRLHSLDVIVRSFVRKWLHLPRDCPNAFIHASTREAGLGITSLERMIPVFLRRWGVCSWG